MSRLRLLRAAMTGAFLFACVVTANADVSKAETTPVMPVATSGPEFRSAVEKQTFLLINAYRRHYGVAQLTWSDDLAKIARAHSKDMEGGSVAFGHDGFHDRVDAAKEKMPLSSAGENVLYTSNLNNVAENAVQMWLHSPHHLKNIRGEYSHSGIGVWQKPDGTIYFTQIFVRAEEGN